jgi:hypothetical protein
MLDISIGLALLAMMLGPAIAAAAWQSESHQAARAKVKSRL